MELITDEKSPITLSCLSLHVTKIAYCLQPVTVISFSLSQSDHIKRLLLYCTKIGTNKSLSITF
jgi:hypothetical protein